MNNGLEWKFITSFGNRSELNILNFELNSLKFTQL